MKGQFTIRACNHGRAKFVVRGRIKGKEVRAFFRTRAEAQSHLEKRNIELFNFGHKLSTMSSALRSEALVVSERLGAFGATLTQAADFYLAHHDWRLKSVPVTQAWEDCRMEFARRVSSNEISLAHLRTVAKAGHKLVRDFGAQYICDLTPQILREWLSGLPITAVSRNNIRTNLSVIFTYAKGCGWIKANPITEVTSFNTHRIKAKLPGIVTPEQAAALLEHAEPEIVPYFAIGLFAGLRVAELERLDWSEIDFEENEINVSAEKAKTAQPRWVPMSENLIEWLLPWRKTSGPVVPGISPRRTCIRLARAAAGITNWGDDKANALRHSFCSYHLALHKNAGLTAHATGHMDSRMIYEHYNNRVKHRAALAYFGIRPAPEAQNIVKIA